jgi:hypothetical protein
MALYLPEKYRKEAMCEAHDSIFGGHNATQKTHQNFYFVLLTKEALIHQKTQKFLHQMPTMEKVYSQENASFVSSNSKKTKLKDTRRFICSNDDG